MRDLLKHRLNLYFTRFEFLGDGFRFQMKCEIRISSVNPMNLNFSFASEPERIEWNADSKFSIICRALLLPKYSSMRFPSPVVISWIGEFIGAKIIGDQNGRATGIN